MTRLMVLGLLVIKPMSGYEMQQLLQQSQTDLWAGILPGSIYHALKKMEKEELVEIEAIERTGNRSKAVYKITEQGHVEFKQLLLTALVEPSVTYPTSLYTAIFFIDALPVQDVLEAIEQQKKKIEKDLETLQEGEKIKATYVPLNEIVQLTFKNMYDHHRIQLAFLTDLQKLLLKKQES